MNNLRDGYACRPAFFFAFCSKKGLKLGKITINKIENPCCKL